MNIFVLDENPEKAANYLCDKHINCMAKEAAQLHSSAVLLRGGSAEYKLTHPNHPCSIWARATKTNWDWLYEHGTAICLEYQRRYLREHRCLQIIKNLSRERHRIPQGDLTTFAQTMPDQYKNTDPVKGYRSFYLGEKSRFAVWRHGPKPEWWTL